MKKILLAMVTLSVLVFALSGCGVFSQPELGKIWNTKGSATIETAYGPFSVKTYSIELKLEFGDIWDPNKVKNGEIEFGPSQQPNNDERVETYPIYTVLSGSYNKDTKLLELNCQEQGAASTKLTVRGRVTNKTEIAENDGFLYNPSDMTNRIGYFTVNQQP